MEKKIAVHNNLPQVLSVLVYDAEKKAEVMMVIPPKGTKMIYGSQVTGQIRSLVRQKKVELIESSTY